MDRIPTELIIEFLEYLSRRDMRSVAGVSRQLYSAAQDAGCCLLRRIRLGAPRGHEDALAMFDAVVEHALSKPSSYRPGIALRLFVHPTAAPDDLETTLERVLEIIKKALPLFVALDVYVPAAFTDALHQTLCESAAPRLRSLVLAQVNDAASPAIAPPAALFAQTAPRLRTICLALPILDSTWQPVAVFRHVVTAHLILYRSTQAIVVSALLPHVQSLIVSLEWHKVSVLLPTQLDLSGLSLRYLVLDGNSQMSCAVSGIDMRKIPIVEGGIGGRFTQSFWDTEGPNAAQIGMCLGRARQSFGTMAPATILTGPGWKRTAYSTTLIRSPLVQTMPSLAIRIKIVLICSASLSYLLGTDIALPDLTEFCLDVSSGAGLSDLDCVRKESARLMCPALRSVTLFAREESFEIHAERVAVLGQMLGQEERSAERRAILKLVRVRFVQPTARTRLDRVFPTKQFITQLDPAMLRLANSCSSEIKDSLVPYPLVRHP